MWQRKHLCIYWDSQHGLLPETVVMREPVLKIFSSLPC